MSELSIKLFGPVQIIHAETLLPNLTSPKIHALVAYLALEPNRPYSRAELAELLWPDRPPGIGRQNLRQTLTRLNRAVNQAVPGLKLLAVTRDTVEMNHEVAQFDALQVISLLTQVRAHDHANSQLCQPCSEKIIQIAALYQGDFLAQLNSDSPAFDDWLHSKQTWFQREVLGALQQLSHLFAERYDGEMTRRYAEQQIEIDPLYEVAHQHLMLAHAMEGRAQEALRHFERFRQILWDELGVEPGPETVALQKDIERGRVQKPSLADPAIIQQPKCNPVQLRNFPVAASAFVGREGEIAEIQNLIDTPDCHLLTLLGYGGLGKTRLALEAARQQATHFKDGAAFIELASVASVDYLPSAIAHGLGYSFSPHVDSMAEQWKELLAYLSEQQRLIILDNLEQLLGNVYDGGDRHDGGNRHDGGDREALPTLIAEMIQAAPLCMTMVTSRQPLHLRVEWIFDVEGLNYPALDGEESIEGLLLEQFESMQLFVQATQRISRRFSPTPQDTQAIAQICQIVEGTPLALELAAGWGRQLSCFQIYSKLVERIDFLSTTMVDVPERHRSIRAVFESTWKQLKSTQQQICARLSILRGPFSEAAALAVAQANEATLATLMDRSLLRRATPFQGEERYEMHELLRQYAAEKLANAPALLMETKRGYTAYFVDFVQSQESALDGAEVNVGVKVIHEQIANVRAVWQHCVESQSIVQLGQLVGGLLRYYNMTNQTEEALANFGNGVAVTRSQRGEESGSVLAQLLSRRARAHYKVARYPEAIADAEEAQRLGARSGNERAEVLGALYWGISLINQGKHDAAQEKLLETRTLARRIDWPKIESDSIRGLGILAQQTGEIDAAQSYYEESLGIGQQINDARGTSACLGNLGNICRQKGDFEQAQRYMAESLAVHQQIGDRSSEARTISMLGDLAMDLEEYSEAESRFQQAYDILTEIGEHHYAADALVSLGECYARLGEAERATPLWERALAQYQSAGEMDQVEMVTKYLEPSAPTRNPR